MFLLLIACAGNPAQQPSDTAQSCTAAWYPDDDRDGFGAITPPVTACSPPAGAVAITGDCDDADASVYPGAPEHCDGEDEDCDGEVDEDAIDDTDWYVDADGDGYGAGPVTATDCLGPSGTSERDDDCDDTDATTFPDAHETWYDGVDSDCGSDDDFDADGDGFAAGGPDGTDCNDGDPDSYPGAPEQCGDGTDQDCDGRDTHCRLLGTYAASDADARLLGNQWAGFSGYDIDAMPGLAGGDDPTLIVSSVEEQDGGWGAGAVQIWQGEPVGDHNLDDAITIFGRSPELDLGRQVAASCDINGDGSPDLLINSFGATDTLEDQGKVYLFNGPITSNSTTDDADRVGVGAAAYDYFGWKMDALGDINQDGYCDWLVGTAFADPHGSLSGSAWVFLGPGSDNINADTAYARIDGAMHDQQVGQRVAEIGDINGDGSPDFALNSNYDDLLRGHVHIFTHLPDGVVTIDEADTTLVGEVDGDVAGVTMADAGDMDGDGYGDLLVGSRNEEGATNGGAVYLVRGPISASCGLDEAHAKMMGTYEDEGAGVDSVASAGDVDGDDHPDVLIGASNHQEPDITCQGSAYLLYGPLTGHIDLNTQFDARFIGDNEWDYMGRQVLGAGDLDDDGFDDIAISTYSYPMDSNKGAVFIWAGGDQ